LRFAATLFFVARNYRISAGSARLTWKRITPMRIALLCLMMVAALVIDKAKRR
jgi:hypothetical protein